MSSPEERELEELGEKAEKYRDILFEINKAFRKQVREVGARKNVVPVKYILPREYIERLLEDRDFKRCWERKLLWVYLKEDEEREGHWVKVQSFPNIGGVLVEEGSPLRVEVLRIPRRKRIKGSKIKDNAPLGRNSKELPNTNNLLCCWLNMVSLNLTDKDSLIALSGK